MVKALYRNKKHPFEDKTSIRVPSQKQGHPRFDSSPNRRRGFQNQCEGFFPVWYQWITCAQRREGPLVWSVVGCSSRFLALCKDCSKESYEPVNQENDAFTYKSINMSGAFFQSSRHTRLLSKHKSAALQWSLITSWLGVTKPYKNSTNWHLFLFFRKLKVNFNIT